MSYLDEINAFYGYLRENPMSTGEIALWHALMHINNKARWSGWFIARNIELEELTGLTIPSLYKVRNKLRQRGFIDYRATSPRHPAEYTLCFSWGEEKYKRSIREVEEKYKRSIREGEEKYKPTIIEDIKTKDIKTKDKNKRARAQCFLPPSIDEVAVYCKERKNKIDAQSFVDFYASKGWMIGKNRMVDWKAAVRSWESKQGRTAQNRGERNYTEEDYKSMITDWVDMEEEIDE